MANPKASLSNRCPTCLIVPRQNWLLPETRTHPNINFPLPTEENKQTWVLKAWLPNFLHDNIFPALTITCIVATPLWPNFRLLLFSSSLRSWSGSIQAAYKIQGKDGPSCFLVWPRTLCRERKGCRVH